MGPARETERAGKSAIAIDRFIIVAEAGGREYRTINTFIDSHHLHQETKAFAFAFTFMAASILISLKNEYCCFEAIAVG